MFRISLSEDRLSIATQSEVIEVSILAIHSVFFMQSNFFLVKYQLFCLDGNLSGSALTRNFLIITNTNILVQNDT